MIMTNTTPANKRHSQRHALLYYLDAFDFYTGQLIGHLMDISIEGAMLFSSTSIPYGHKIKLHIALPAGFSGGNFLNVEAEVVRSIRDINADYHNIGLRFIDLNLQNQVIIECLINDYVF